MDECIRQNHVFRECGEDAGDNLFESIPLIGGTTGRGIDSFCRRRARRHDRQRYKERSGAEGLGQQWLCHSVSHPVVIFRVRRFRFEPRTKWHCIDGIHIRTIVKALCVRIESFAAIGCGNWHNCAFRSELTSQSAQSLSGKASSASDEQAVARAVKRRAIIEAS